MGIFNKVLKVNSNKKIKKFDEFGVIYLYPENTERIVKKLTFKGYKLVKEYCKIEKGENIYHPRYYNKWYEK